MGKHWQDNRAMESYLAWEQLGANISRGLGTLLSVNAKHIGNRAGQIQFKMR